MIYDLFDFLDDSEQFPSSGHFSYDEPQIWQGIPYSGEPMYDSYVGYPDDDYNYQEGNW